MNQKNFRGKKFERKKVQLFRRFYLIPLELFSLPQMNMLYLYVFVFHNYSYPHFPLCHNVPTIFTHFSDIDCQNLQQFSYSNRFFHKKSLFEYEKTHYMPLNKHEIHNTRKSYCDGIMWHDPLPPYLNKSAPLAERGIGNHDTIG